MFLPFLQDARSILQIGLWRTRVEHCSKIYEMKELAVTHFLSGYYLGLGRKYYVADCVPNYFQNSF